MPDSKKMSATFAGEDQSHVVYASFTIEVDDLQAAVAIGVKSNASFFTIDGENAGRYYTPLSYQIKSASQIIDYLQERSRYPLEQEVLSRMFNRVSRNPEDQEKFSQVISIQDAISLLQEESPDARFLVPSNGGYIKLEQNDKVYNREGQQIWPVKMSQQGKSFKL